MTPAIALIQWLSFLFCVGIGYLLSLRLRPPESPTLWLLLVAAVFVIGYLPFLTQLIFIFGAPVQLNNLLWGIGIGIVLGFMLKRAQRKA
jgi:hypothetical protein